MIDEKVKDEIIAFLEAKEPDCEKAVALMIKYGTNKSEVRVFSTSPERYYSQLRWHLAKLIGIKIIDFQKGNFSGVDKPVKDYPLVIVHIKEVLPGIFNERAELQKQLIELGEANDDVTKAKALELGGQIDELAVRYQLLFEAKELFFNEGIEPSEEELFPEPEDTTDLTARDATDPFGIVGKDPIELMKRKSNLESSLAKDRNLLKYQSKTALEAENLMPDGAEKDKVSVRVLSKEQELAAINAFLKTKEDAGKPE